MEVTPDADAIFIRPMPFECSDVYAVTDRLDDVVTGRYLHTEGPRKQIDQYRRALTKLGTGRAFAIRKERVQ